MSTAFPDIEPEMANQIETHEVLNQSGDLFDYDAFSDDQVLTSIVRKFDGDWANDKLRRAGSWVGSEQVQTWAHQANKVTPTLHTHDRFGNRISGIEFHPAWYELMRKSFQSETHSLSWTNDRTGSHVARAALSYLWNQGESGICCPSGMTFASIAALRHAPDLAEYWEPKILANNFDERAVPAEEKTGLTVGMAMTEKQGGSDLRRTQTIARPASNDRGSGATYLLTGHKWFFSVPQSDIFLTLAQTDKGVSCFLARGWLEDGSRNKLQLQRLKEKCGNRSNASSEVEFRDLEAVLVGEEGRGIRNIIEMAHLTRLDFAVGSAGLMRQALSQTIHHTTNRSAFQKRLIDQPIMTNVLTDLAIESEAMTWMTFRCAATLDRAEQESERLLGRIATPMAKYWACKQAVPFVAEALECHGGNGFIETHLMARLYREAPLNGIWEGSGNVICLDVVRAIEREPEVVDAFLDEVRLASGEPRLDKLISELETLMPTLPSNEFAARSVVERMALAFQASLLLRHSSSNVSEAFCASRLSDRRSGQFGDLQDIGNSREILARAALGSP